MRIPLMVADTAIIYSIGSEARLVALVYAVPVRQNDTRMAPSLLLSVVHPEDWMESRRFR
jgi:hypothetical protein